MPKLNYLLNNFHGGINNSSDPRDIKDDELAIIQDGDVDSVGQITMSGDVGVITTSSKPTLDDLIDGYGLFRFGSDYNASGSEARTNYIIAWDDKVGKFYWLPGSSTWATPSNLDASSDWGTEEDSKPIYYYVDGALRVSDGNFSNSNNDSLWIGVVDRTLFPDGYQGGDNAITGWHKEKQELLTPTVGSIDVDVPSDASGVPTGGVRWRVRNMYDKTVQLYPFDDTMSSYSNEGIYDMTEYYGSDSNDESWQVCQRGVDGYSVPGLAASSNYHWFGIGMHNEDDDASVEWKWQLKSYKKFNGTGESDQKLTTGKSLYVAVRLSGDEQKNIWLGTHYRPLKDNNFLNLQIDDCYIKVHQDSGGNYMKWRIDHTKFTDSTTPSGVWHVIELPYDDNFEKSISGDFFPERFDIEMRVSWQRKGSVETIDTGSDSASTNPGIEFFQLSDLRIGESELVGVDTVGKQKFSMSYTYDDTENESLLYNFGGGSSQEIVFQNTTSAYKIGIEAYVKPPSNKRVTGANLYMEDDGIPYRIAELRYMDGIRGSWEQEFPSSQRFVSAFSNAVNKSGLIKTDGLPLLESYEAMNGFSPKVRTTSARYKTAVILNRQVYAGNILQNGKIYGDRMIKSTTNSFDSFPTEGREIDVVQNDGDEIVKLEVYADRILQFKRNVMYLINATRGAEYLEDTFEGKGVVSDSAVVKTDMGIAWANENGCYLYNGEKVNNLTDGLIDDSDWATHVNSSTDVIFYPLKQKILVTGGTGGEDIYAFTLYTKSWTYIKGKLSQLKTNFIVDVDNDIKYLNATNLFRWNDTVSDSDNFRALTKDFDFGNPAKRKKCFKFYVTYRANSDANVKVYYGTNGLNLTGNATGTEVAASKFASTSDDAYVTGDGGLKSTGGEWKQAELKPPNPVNNVYSIQLHFKASGTVPSNFAINDITIVYREKPIK